MESGLGSGVVGEGFSVIPIATRAPFTRSPTLLVFPVYFSSLSTLGTKSATHRTTGRTLLVLVALPVCPSSDELVSARGKEVRTGEGVGASLVSGIEI